MQMGSDCVASTATQIQIFRRRPWSGEATNSNLSERGHAQGHPPIKYECNYVQTIPHRSVNSASKVCCTHTQAVDKAPCALRGGRSNKQPYQRQSITDIAIFQTLPNRVNPQRDVHSWLIMTQLSTLSLKLLTRIRQKVMFVRRLRMSAMAV